MTNHAGNCPQCGGNTWAPTPEGTLVCETCSATPSATPAQPNEIADATPATDPTTPANDTSGNVTSVAEPASSSLEDDPTRPREPLKVTVKRRLEQEGRWHGKIELERNEMVRQARGEGMSKLEAQEWVYSELDRLYPPLEHAPESGGAGDVSGSGNTSSEVCKFAKLTGLADIPDSWGELPSNASLASEIGWVQAERLRVVEEKGQQTVVHLDQARSPAPSWAALGWLETSIRAYAKFVDVVAKAAATSTDEAELVRREKMRIEEVRSLLAEMIDAGN